MSLDRGGKNPRRQHANTEKLWSPGDLKHKPGGCEATVLITTPPDMKLIFRRNETF